MELGKIVIKNQEICYHAINRLIDYNLLKYDDKYGSRIPVRTIVFENCTIRNSELDLFVNFDNYKLLKEVDSIHFLKCSIHHLNLGGKGNDNTRVYFTRTLIDHLNISNAIDIDTSFDDLSFLNCEINNLKMQGCVIRGHLSFNGCKFSKLYDNKLNNIIRSNRIGLSVVFGESNINSLEYYDNEFLENPNISNKPYVLFRDTVLANSNRHFTDAGMITIKEKWENLKFCNTTINTLNAINEQNCYQANIVFGPGNGNILTYYYFPGEDIIFEDYTIQKYGLLRSSKPKNNLAYAKLMDFKKMLVEKNKSIDAVSYNMCDSMIKYFEDISNIPD